jgi:sialic acid synthase SpsE
MYNDAVAIAEEYADLIKIRYKDNENEELINLALDTGKDLIISVSKPPLFRGGGTLINMVNPHIYPIYCIPRYPPLPEDFCLDTACATKGFSSHFPHTTFDLAFVINRMFDDSFIEKHFMLDDQPLTATPAIDEAVSISFTKMGDFIKQLKLLNQMRRIRM